MIETKKLRGIDLAFGPSLLNFLDIDYCNKRMNSISNWYYFANGFKKGYYVEYPKKVHLRTNIWSTSDGKI